MQSPDYPIQIISPAPSRNHNSQSQTAYIISTPNGPSGNVFYHATPLQSINSVEFANSVANGPNKSGLSSASKQISKKSQIRKQRRSVDINAAAAANNNNNFASDKDNIIDEMEGKSYFDAVTKLSMDGLDDSKERNDNEDEMKRKQSRYPSLPDSESMIVDPVKLRQSRSNSNSCSMTDSSALYNNADEGLFDNQTTNQGSSNEISGKKNALKSSKLTEALRKQSAQISVMNINDIHENKTDMKKKNSLVLEEDCADLDDFKEVEITPTPRNEAASEKEREKFPTPKIANKERQ